MLDASGISVRFGGVVAVDDVDLVVAAGEVAGVIGPNGSGKTTLLNALTGVVPAGGALRVCGERVPLANPRRIYLAGVARVFQHPQTFAALSVLDSTLLAHRDASASGLAAAWFARPAMRRHDRRRRSDALAALDEVGLSALADAPSAQLPYGQQRLAEIARALCSSPKVLLLDEPSAGLNDDETAALAAIIERVRSSGCAVVVVDHKIALIDRLCDHVTVMELGAKIAGGTPAEVWADERVAAAYLGEQRRGA